MTLNIGTAQRVCRGETICGDSIVIVPGDVTTTIVVADGLGHGPKAGEAATAFTGYVERHPLPNLDKLMRDASASISGTRGAAAAIVRLDETLARLWFVGIGNIELVSHSLKPIRPVCRPGIVGRPLRKVIVFDYEINVGDLIAVFSDGISGRGLEIEDYLGVSPQEIANSMLRDHGKDHDDATCVVARVE